MIDRGGSGGCTNKIKSRLSIVDRGGSWCWSYKVKSSLGIVVWGWSRSRANKVQGGLCIVDWGRSNRGGNECKLSILVCLPLGRSLDLNLSLATTGSSSRLLLLLEPVVARDRFRSRDLRSGKHTRMLSLHSLPPLLDLPQSTMHSPP